MRQIDSSPVEFNAYRCHLLPRNAGQGKTIPNDWPVLDKPLDPSVLELERFCKTSSLLLQMNKLNPEVGHDWPKVNESCNHQHVGKRQPSGLQGKVTYCYFSYPLLPLSFVSLSFPGAKGQRRRSRCCHGNQRAGCSPH